MEYFGSRKSRHISGHEPSDKHPVITVKVVLLYRIHRVPVQPDNYEIFRHLYLQAGAGHVYKLNHV